MKVVQSLYEAQTYGTSYPRIARSCSCVPSDTKGPLCNSSGARTRFENAKKTGLSLIPATPTRYNFLTEQPWHRLLA
jgi:hypothetical protein